MSAIARAAPRFASTTDTPRHPGVNVLDRVCAEREDAYHTRRQELLIPPRKYSDETFFVMLAFYGQTLSVDQIPRAGGYAALRENRSWLIYIKSCCQSAAIVGSVWSCAMAIMRLESVAGWATPLHE